MHTKPQSQLDVLNTTMSMTQKNRFLINDVSVQLISCGLLSVGTLLYGLPRSHKKGLTFTE